MGIIDIMHAPLARRRADCLGHRRRRPRPTTSHPQSLSVAGPTTLTRQPSPLSLGQVRKILPLLRSHLVTEADGLSRFHYTFAERKSDEAALRAIIDGYANVKLAHSGDVRKVGRKLDLLERHLLHVSVRSTLLFGCYHRLC
jgi:hypothetical protein